MNNEVFFDPFVNPYLEENPFRCNNTFCIDYDFLDSNSNFFLQHPDTVSKIINDFFHIALNEMITSDTEKQVSFITDEMITRLNLDSEKTSGMTLGELIKVINSIPLLSEYEFSKGEMLADYCVLTVAIMRLKNMLTPVSLFLSMPAFVFFDQVSDYSENYKEIIEDNPNLTMEELLNKLIAECRKPYIPIVKADKYIKEITFAHLELADVYKGVLLNGHSEKLTEMLKKYK